MVQDYKVGKKRGKFFVSYLLYTSEVTLKLGVRQATSNLKCILTKCKIITIYFVFQIELLVYDVIN